MENKHLGLNEVIALDKKYYMNTFGDRIPVCFVSGKGIELTATDGKVYKDFFAGIAVNSLGYGDEEFTSALKEQIDNLIHTSSVYYVENQARLAKALVENTCADRVFFANTGAEANEGAIKLAKKYQLICGRPERREFVTLFDSFHGRTLATVAATGQPKYQKPYLPLLEKFVHIERDDMEGLKNAVNDKTAGIILELIQGESGVHPLSEEFVHEVRRICDENDIVLIVDEVQTGVGRTGKLFAYERYGIEPDIFTMAKGLGGGVPIGAFAAKEKIADAFKPGDHGTTFGGNPLSTRAGLVVLDKLLNKGLLKHAEETGEYFEEKLNALKADNPIVKEVRGAGLMQGVEFSEPIAKDANNKLFERGYLVGVIGDRTFRLVPPLVVTKADIDGLAACLGGILKEY